MKLLYTPLSPFARKVRVAALELGLTLDLVEVDPWETESPLAAYNPALRVPVLCHEGLTLPGSTLICEYLDTLHKHKPLVPESGAERWQVLRLHALADGMLEACVAHVVERVRRPESLQYSYWLDRQEIKITASLDLMETLLPDNGRGEDLATITLACALEYLNIRLAHLNWQKRYPTLDAWYSEKRLRPSMLNTRPLAPHA
jgi:glutathione S-transferase